jgi:hypothetical protein
MVLTLIDRRRTAGRGLSVGFADLGARPVARVLAGTAGKPAAMPATDADRPLGSSMRPDL